MIRNAVLFVLCCLSVTNANDCYAQKPFSSSTEYERTIFTEGDLVYVQDEDGYILRLEAENMKGGGLSLDLMIDVRSFDEMRQELFQTVFPKRRAKELENHQLRCNLHFNVETKNMDYVSFIWRGEGEFPFRLSELKKLEDALIHFPYKITSIKNTRKRGYVHCTCPVIFKNMYTN
jgi:hypothetical protein